ncbi:hypothetical protein AZI87_09990 [Bdellovibrio bacteriovorus]|uniref:RCC1-like domain-containing protein n=2 Tax=Bdellovibrio bacteriovorus TaxID=959 RepID=A0A162H2E9_BDEBC|nr:hypothetical protein AZI87_09990 [Bdellovibrio bacteriovorus]
MFWVYTQEVLLSSILERCRWVGNLFVAVIAATILSSCTLDTQLISGKSLEFFSVTSESEGRINGSNMAATPFKGSCVPGSKVTITEATAILNHEFTCDNTGSWSRSLDLSVLPANYIGELVFTMIAPTGQSFEQKYPVEKDVVPPTVTIDAPVAVTPMNEGSYPITGNCSENGKTVTLIAGTISTTTVCTAGAYSANLDVSSVLSSPISISASLVDAAGNVGNASASASRTGAPPVITSFALNNGNTVTTNNVVTVDMSVTDVTEMYLTEVAGCASGGSWVSYSATASWTLPALNATNTLYAKFRNASGETLCVSDSIVHDSTSPTITIDSPAANSYVNIANVSAFTISGSCSELNRSITITGPSGYTATTTCLGTSYSAILDLTALPQGNFILSASLSDEAGNSGSANSANYIKDTAAPAAGTITINSGQAGTTNLNVTLTVSNVAGTSEYYITNAADCSSGGVWESYVASKAWVLPTANATNTVRMKRRDTAGNESSCTSDSIVHTSSVPSLSLASPTAGSYIGLMNAASFTVSGACSEEGIAVTLTANGVTQTSPPLCTGGSWTKTLNLSSGTYGQGNVTVVANHARMTGVAAPSVTVVFVKDTVAPTATMAINNGDAYTNNLAATLNLSMAGGATEMYITNNALCLTGGTWEPFAVTKSWTLPTANDNNWIYYKARDAAGNETNCLSDTIIHDTVIPSLAVTMAVGTYINGVNQTAFEITGTCSEYGRPITLSLAGEPSITGTTTCAGGFWSMTVNASGIADNTSSTYSFSFVHTRPSGNMITAFGHFYKDTVPPGNATLTNAPSGTNANSALNVTVGGAGVNLFKYFLIRPGETNSCSAPTSYLGSDNFLSSTISDRILVNGDYKLCVWGRDTAGNWSPAHTEASWTRDALTAVITGAPTGVSSATSVNITVSGTSVTQYKKAFITSGTCATATYSGQVPVGTAITDNISAIPNGPVTLCVIGSDTFGTWQSETAATEVTWIKDAISTVQITSASQNRVNEGDSGQNITFTINPVKNYDVIVYYKVTGDALNSTHHNLSSGSVTIPANTASATITANFPDNALVEGEKVLNVHITRTSTIAAILGINYQAQYFIADDEKNLKVTAVALNQRHSCAILSDGFIRCWGYNSSQALGTGDGNFRDRAALVTVAGNPTFASISTGHEHTCAITTSGVLYCWGTNTVKQLGDGTSTNRSSPVIADSPNLYLMISTGNRHTCGITINNKLRCWGSNSYGEIGKGTTSPIPSDPVEVDGATDYKYVSVGADGSCAVTSTHKLRCWGNNGNGALPTGGSFNTPQDVDSTTDYSMVAVGSSHSCAVTMTGQLKCWGGANSWGQIGDGTNIAKSSPTNVDSSETFVSVAVNTDTNATSRGTTCALTTGKVLYCFGFNDAGQVADGTSGNSRRSPTLSDGGMLYDKIALGAGRVCGIPTSGYLRCWGNFGFDSGASQQYNSFGAGHNIGFFSRWGEFFKDFNFDTVSFGGGGHHDTVACGISNKKLYCWGTTEVMGDGTTATVRRPAPVLIDADTNYVQVASRHSSDHCAITESGDLKCWGRNHYGELGSSSVPSTGSAPRVNVPTLVDPGYKYVHVSMENHGTCGVTTTGDLRCAGFNGSGQLGDGTITAVAAFKTIDAPTKYKTVERGFNHTCGITTTGMLKCWGTNTNGHLGIGNTTNNPNPTEVDPGVTYKSISLGSTYTCGVTTAGKLKCWGGSGDVGNGSSGNVVNPYLIDGANDYLSVYSGADFACGILTSNAVKCWSVHMPTVGLAQPPFGNTVLNQLNATLIDSGMGYSKILTAGDMFCGLTLGKQYRCHGFVEGAVGGDVDTSVSVSNVNSNFVYQPIYLHKMFY